MSATDEAEPPVSKKLPLAVQVIGVILAVGSSILAGRLIWEMTSLTWNLGPQMIGFSLALGSYAFLLLFPILLFLWIVTSMVLVIVWKLKGYAIQQQTWLLLGGAATVLGVLSIPNSLWDALFVTRLANSSHSAELFVYAAAHGETTTVRGLLARGVSINARDHEGNTALHLAAAAGQTQIVINLIANGADVNAVNLWGDSPLERATANRSSSCSKLLIEHGGKDIKGDSDQRQRAAAQIVSRDIDRMHSRP